MSSAGRRSWVCLARRRLNGSCLMNVPPGVLVCWYVFESTMVRMSCLMLQFFLVNSMASQSRSSGLLGYSPWSPKSPMLLLRPDPKNWLQSLLTNTRAVSGLSGEAIHLARSRRVSPIFFPLVRNSGGAGWTMGPSWFVQSPRGSRRTTLRLAEMVVGMVLNLWLEWDFWVMSCWICFCCVVVCGVCVRWCRVRVFLLSGFDSAFGVSTILVIFGVSLERSAMFFVVLIPKLSQNTMPLCWVNVAWWMCSVGFIWSVDAGISRRIHLPVSGRSPILWYWMPPAFFPYWMVLWPQYARRVMGPPMSWIMMDDGGFFGSRYTHL